MSSVKEAERLKKYLEEAPGRELERKKQLKEKLENLNKEIERIDGQMVASTSARPLPEGEKLVEQEKVIVGVKRKAGAQEDKYLEESKEIVGNVRSAVQAGKLIPATADHCTDQGCSYAQEAQEECCACSVCGCRGRPERQGQSRRCRLILFRHVVSLYYQVF